MATLIFRWAEVRPLVQHAKECTEHRLSFDERLKIYGENCYEAQPGEEKLGKPGLWLVKDQGVYLMSNGIPGIKEDGSTRVKQDDEFVSNMVVYAKGIDPKKNPETWWDQADELGGDDFVELIPLVGPDFDEEWDELIIKISEEEMQVGFSRKASKKGS